MSDEEIYLHIKGSEEKSN